MKRSTLFIPLMFVIVFALTACGSGKKTNTIDVNMVEFTFTPSEFTIPAGQEITITARNNGAVEHEFDIFNLGTNAGDSFGDEDRPNVYWSVKVQPGEKTTTTFTAPTEAGEYYITCGTPGHLQAGMSGKLIVVAGG
jgi:uncharacterized cupredoxin-like copper-binding protein